MELELSNRRHARFSRNDEHNDLSGENVPYLLVDFMLAVCHESLSEERLNVLEVAKGLYFRFFERLIQYRILNTERPEVKVFKRLLFEDHDEAEEEKLLSWLRQPTRDLKIERMKILLQMKKQLEPLEVPANNADEDATFAYWTRVLNIFALVAFDNLSLLLLELELLQNGMSMPANNVPQRPPRPSPTVAIIAKPFKLVKDRQQVAADVFRPGYNLPTMTIDEYLDLEMKRGNIISSKDSSSEKAQPDEDSEAYLDMQLKKEREFDEFKDSKHTQVDIYL